MCDIKVESGILKVADTSRDGGQGAEGEKCVVDRGSTKTKYCEKDGETGHPNVKS